MKLNAQIIVKDCKGLYKSISNEMIKKERSSMRIKENKNEVVLEVDAKDTTSFKASMLSIIKYIDVYENVRNV